MMRWVVLLLVGGGGVARAQSPSTRAALGAARVVEAVAARGGGATNASVDWPATAADTASSFYVARASGPALLLGGVERSGATLRATFDEVPVGGAYLVEVVRVLDRVDAFALLANRTPAEGWPCASRPPDATAFLAVAVFAASPRPAPLERRRGDAHWINVGGDAAGFLRTRYQVCGHASCGAAACGVEPGAVDEEAAQGLARFAPYRWGARRPGGGVFAPKNATAGGPRGPVVCLLGASHARRACRAIGARCHYLEILLARDVRRPAFVRSLVAVARETRCKVVATFGPGQEKG